MQKGLRLHKKRFLISAALQCFGLVVIILLYKLFEPYFQNYLNDFLYQIIALGICVCIAHCISIACDYFFYPFEEKDEMLENAPIKKRPKIGFGSAHLISIIATLVIHNAIIKFYDINISGYVYYITFTLSLCIATSIVFLVYAVFTGYKNNS